MTPIDKILNRYEGTDYVLKMKARFFFSLCVAILVIIPIITLYGTYVNLQDPGGGNRINYPLLAAEIVTFFIVLSGFYLLIRGRFSLAAHLVFLASVLVVWCAMAIDHVSVLARLDSVALILALLSMTPLVVSRRKRAIIIYGAINIFLLFAFMYVFRAQLQIPASLALEYLGDISLAMLFISFAAYNIFNINQKALDRAVDDIRERKSAEEKLSFQMSILEAQNEAAHDGILMVDEDGRIITYNRRFREMFDIPFSIIKEKSDDIALQYVSNQLIDPQGFLAQVREIYQRRREILADELALKDERTFERYSAPIHNDQDQYLGRVWYFHDITGRRRDQAEKARLEEQLRQSQKMESIGRLAGGVAHDFNNLLTAIMGNTELALMTMNAQHPLHKKLSVVMQAAQSAGELTRQLLAFSRKQIIEPKSINLNELIEHMHKMLVRLIGEDIQLQYVTQPAIGLIKADRGQIEQIIVNLAVNARDAMPEGGRLTIETFALTLDDAYVRQHSYVTTGDYIVLAVSDTGSGMSDEAKNHLFEPFFTTKPPGTGTGLGLAMVYGAVRQNGASIEVYSEIGRGTTFKIYFPRQDDMPAIPLEVDDGQTLSPGTETILLVEDDPHVREFTLGALKDLGYTVLPYSNGEEALAAMKSDAQEIHLLLTDVILPGMNGRVLAEAITRISTGVKVLFASGYTDNVIIRHGVLEEGIHFIGKPFSVQALAQKIRDVLDRRA